MASMRWRKMLEQVIESEFRGALNPNAGVLTKKKGAPVRARLWGNAPA